MALPESIERDLTLAHAETCLCHTDRSGVGKACREVRDILRRVIQAELLRAEAYGIDSAWHRYVVDRGRSRQHPTTGCQQEAASLRAHADAIERGET